MIQNAQELAACLDYAAKWADTLEGLRRHAQETDAALLPTTSAGPLSEIRRVLAEARQFMFKLDQTPEDPPAVHTIVAFGGGPTGYISVNAVSEGPATYAYMPFRNLPHLELGRAIEEQGQAEVIVRLKSGAIPMTATELKVRSITLAEKASPASPNGVL